MARTTSERALWLGRNILCHEAALRLWLSGRRIDGLEVDDVIQEAYARIATLETVEGIQNPKAYLFQTANSLVINHIRHASVVSIRAVADLDEVAAASDSPSPETETADREELRKLRDAIARLPDKTRRLFLLTRLHGLSHRDVADRTGVPPSTVEKHVARAIHLLMDSFSRGGESGLKASIRSRPNNRSRSHAQGDKPRY